MFFQCDQNIFKINNFFFAKAPHGQLEGYLQKKKKSQKTFPIPINPPHPLIFFSLQNISKNLSLLSNFITSKSQKFSHDQGSTSMLSKFQLSSSQL